MANSLPRHAVVVVLATVLVATSCQLSEQGRGVGHAQKAQSRVVRNDWVIIGYVDSADPLQVLHSLERVLGANGIDVAIEGSVLCDLLVPKGDASRAMYMIRHMPEFQESAIHLYDRPRPSPQ